MDMRIRGRDVYMVEKCVEMEFILYEVRVSGYWREWQPFSIWGGPWTK